MGYVAEVDSLQFCVSVSVVAGKSADVLILAGRELPEQGQNRARAWHGLRTGAHACVRRVAPGRPLANPSQAPSLPHG